MNKGKKRNNRKVTKKPQWAETKALGRMLAQQAAK
jgi:hypothetical protein